MQKNINTSVVRIRVEKNLYLKSMIVSKLGCYQDHTQSSFISHFNINQSIVYVHVVVDMVHVEFYPTWFYVHLV